jgi:hypothetical protein
VYDVSWTFQKSLWKESEAQHFRLEYEISGHNPQPHAPLQYELCK